MDAQHGKQPCNCTDYTDGTVQREYIAKVQTNLDILDKRYLKPASDHHSVKPLVEKIGEDLSSPSEETRLIASISGYYASHILEGYLREAYDEREAHWPEWQHESGRDQRFVNEGIDCFSKLHRASVKESRQEARVANLDTLYALNLPEHYYSVVLTYGFTKPWFDLIDKDFSNPLREVREIAWIAFNLSYISRFEDKMDREGTQHVYNNCYRRLVVEGVFTKPRKHNIAKIYFKFSLANAESNEKTRHIDVRFLTDEEWESRAEELATESAENEAMEEINLDELGSDLQQEGLMTEQGWLFAKLRYVDGLTSKEIEKWYGIKAGTVRNEETERNKRVILQRDRCFAFAITRLQSHFDVCAESRLGRFGGVNYLDFTDHSKRRVNEIERSLKIVQEDLASFTGSGPLFLPLTSGIDRQLGRLYIHTGTHESGRNCLRNHLLHRGKNPTEYVMITCKIGPAMWWKEVGFPPFDEIIQRVRDFDTEPRLFVLSFRKNVISKPTDYRSNFGDFTVSMADYLRRGTVSVEPL